MNLLWHIIRKDLGHVCWLLLAWMVLTLIPVTFGIWALGGSEEVVGLRRDFQRINEFLMPIQAIVVIFITCTVVHSDRLVGNTAHWISLPVSGGHLLLAKLAGLGLMLWVLPLTILLPWWLANHFDLSDIGWVIGIKTLWLALVVLPSLLVAVMTDGWPRFMLWMLLMMMVCIGGMMLIFTVASLPVEDRPPTDVLETRTVLVSLIALAAGTAAVICQYLRRHLKTSLALLGGGVVLALGILMAWPWVLGSRPISGARGVPFSHGEVVPVEWTEPIARRSPTQDHLEIEFEVQVGAMEAGKGWYGRIHHAEVGWADGTVGVMTRNFKGTWPLISQSRRLDGDESQTHTLIPDYGRHFTLNVQGFLPTEAADRVLRERPTLRLGFRQWLFENTFQAEFPLETGSRFGSGSLRYTVIGSERIDPLEHQIIVIESKPGIISLFGIGHLPDDSLTLRAPVDAGMLAHANSQREVSQIGFFNRSEREAVESVGRWGNTTFGTDMIGTFAGVQVRRHRASIRPPQRVLSRTLRTTPFGGRIYMLPVLSPPDVQWLDEAKLVWMMGRTLAWSESIIETENLVVEDRRSRAVGPNAPD